MIELPSGRALAYPKASVGENSWGSQVVEFMGLDLNRKWSKLKNIWWEVSREYCSSNCKGFTCDFYS